MNTGHLSLIEDADLRRVISRVYGAFDVRETWRPSADAPFRRAVLRTIPLDFMERVMDECVRVEGTVVARSVLADCTTVPRDGRPEEWLAALLERPDLIGDLSERVYGVCRFDDQSEYAQAIADTLYAYLDAELR